MDEIKKESFGLALHEHEKHTIKRQQELLSVKGHEEKHPHLLETNSRILKQTRSSKSNYNIKVREMYGIVHRVFPLSPNTTSLPTVPEASPHASADG